MLKHSKNILLPLLLALVPLFACKKASSTPGEPDYISPECAAVSWPPDDGGVQWTTGAAADVDSAAAAEWVTVSNDSECDGIEPASVSATSLHWNGQDGAGVNGWCDAPSVDQNGDLSIFFATTTQPYFGTAFFHQTAPAPAEMLPGDMESFGAVAARKSGFGAITHATVATSHPNCNFVRVLDATGAPVSVDSLSTSPAGVENLWPNPAGGFVQHRLQTVSGPSDDNAVTTLLVRWVDDDLTAASDWYAVTQIKQVAVNQYTHIYVDVKGAALVLTFLYPPSYTSTQSTPSDWTFTARWMSAHGPLTDSFVPLAPVASSSSGKVGFADWGSALLLPGGGFAFYKGPSIQSGATISYTGWYAAYHSDSASPQSAPSWLSSTHFANNGATQLVNGGRAFGTVERVPNSCDRIISLVSLNGKICKSRNLKADDACTSFDSLSPDETVITQTGCSTKWWPSILASK